MTRLDLLIDEIDDGMSKQCCRSLAFQFLHLQELTEYQPKMISSTGFAVYKSTPLARAFLSLLVVMTREIDDCDVRRLLPESIQG